LEFNTCQQLACLVTVDVCCMYSDSQCLNERYIFIALSGCFFACTRTASLLQLGYFQLGFPPVVVCHSPSFKLFLHHQFYFLLIYLEILSQ